MKILHRNLAGAAACTAGRCRLRFTPRVGQDGNFILVNKASPKLFLACAKGEHFKEVVLAVRRTGASPAEFLKWRFTDVLISSYQTAGDSATGALPVDDASLKFSKIEVEYSPVKPDGTLGTPVKAGWDRKANKPV